MARGGFDITKGTILDSELRPEHFDQVTRAIFEKIDLGQLFTTPKNTHLVLTLEEQCRQLSKLILHGHGNAQR